jgi:hypothetical protein
MTIHGKHYLLEFDEYAFRFSGNAPPNTVGAARIIDISDEQHPRVVSNLRLEVDQPTGHHQAVAAGDPGTIDPAQGYAAHYCNVPQEVDPQIVACSFITSGLRVFDIRDPLRPREVAYFVAPPNKAPENGYNGSNFAMSKPAFDPQNREIWYSDGGSGFYVLRVDNNVWPTPGGASPSCPAPSGKLAGHHLGPIALGERRAALRRKLGHFSTRRLKTMDFFCLADGGLRAGYPSSKLLRSLSKRQRARFANRVVLTSTSDPYYSLDGVKPGTPLARALHKLRIRARLTIGRNTWYVVQGRSAAGILKVQHRVVEEVGIADKALTANQPRRFLASFN